MIKKVTMTGADDSIKPSDLIKLQIKYPFVEWGILVSNSSYGLPRFPSQLWLEDLTLHTQLNLSCHLCGKYVKQFMAGDERPIIDLQARNDVWNQFKRVQLNTHGLKHNFDPAGMLKLINTFCEMEYIIQFDNNNNHILEHIKTHAENISILHDLSHGAGVLPTKWPDLLPGIATGFAGGLSPENVVEQIKLIEEIAGDIEIWIDAETHLRSNNGYQFDLQLVDKFLGACEPHVTY